MSPRMLAPQSSASRARSASAQASQAPSLARRLGNQGVQTLLQRVERLAEDPAEAHRHWRQLGAREQERLVEVMQQLYGPDFAGKFREVAESGAAQLDFQHWQPGVGPSPRRLRELGYRRKGKVWLGSADIDVEWWVHPSGKTVYRDVSIRPAPLQESGGRDQPPVDDQDEAVQMLRQMTVANNQLTKYCETRPLEEGKAAGAILDFGDALGRLQNKLKDVDMSRHPHFWKKVETQITRYAVVRVPCCEAQPNNFWFDCKSIMGPDDDE